MAVFDPISCVYVVAVFHLAKDLVRLTGMVIVAVSCFLVPARVVSFVRLFVFLLDPAALPDLANTVFTVQPLGAATSLTDDILAVACTGFFDRVVVVVLLNSFRAVDLHCVLVVALIVLLNGRGFTVSLPDSTILFSIVGIVGMALFSLFSAVAAVGVMAVGSLFRDVVVVSVADFINGRGSVAARAACIIAGRTALGLISALAVATSSLRTGLVGVRCGTLAWQAESRARRASHGAASQTK
jgi:hypothetical protein